MEILKTAKWKMQQKTLWQEQLGPVSSQIVSFYFSLNFAFWLKTLNPIGVSAKQKKQTNIILDVKNWSSKYKFKTGPSMLRNIIGPVFNL